MKIFKKQILPFLLVLFLTFGIVIPMSSKKIDTNSSIPVTYIYNTDEKKSLENVFDSLHLDAKGLSHNAFDYAIKGFSELKKKKRLKNDSIITIVDFDQPSCNKRMYIIDLKNYKILFNTWTAHGRNTGGEFAKYFSNKVGSKQSSLGLYVTDKTYYGGNGYSLKLIGLDDSNSNAEDRAIVLHGADYVSQSAINSLGYIGRSYGCPAVAKALTKPIIEKIKGGSCFFIYNKAYQSNL